MNGIDQREIVHRQILSSLMGCYFFAFKIYAGLEFIYNVNGMEFWEIRNEFLGRKFNKDLNKDHQTFFVIIIYIYINDDDEDNK